LRLLRVLADWLGAAALCCAPFIIDTTEGKILAIVGLGLLTLQALRVSCYNLVFLNIIGIGGYFYAIYF